MKPHIGEVKEMLCNERGNTLISSSDDETIFIHNLSTSMNGVELIPIGFIPTNSTVQQIDCFDCTKGQVISIFNLTHSPIVFHSRSKSIANYCDGNDNTNTHENKLHTRD